jgi:cytosine/adenosine deaminase-related metal-dependent hydrolase
MGEARCGLVVGALADIVVLDTDRAEFAGVADEALLDAWMFAPRPHALGSVWIGGECVVQSGRHIAHAQVSDAYRATVARLAGV